MNNYGCYDNMYIRFKVYKSWCGKYWVFFCGNRKFLKKYIYLKIKSFIICLFLLNVNWYLEFY